MPESNPPGTYSVALTGGIKRLRQKHDPRFDFEWHPDTRVVYVFPTGVDYDKVVADPIAHEVKTHAQAWMYVLVWLRGYRAAESGYGTEEEIGRPLLEKIRKVS